jgi:segregation and condensation protein B
MSGASNEHANDDGTEVSEEMVDAETVVKVEAPEDMGLVEESEEVNVTALPVDEPEPDEADEDEAEDTPDPELHQKSLRILEAVLFATAEPMTERMLANRLPDGSEVKVLLKELQAKYDGGGVQLNKSGTSWAFRTAPDLSDFLNKEVEVARKLSRAAIETLAIIAYHQPVTRAEIEEIRGVSISKGTMDVLLEAEWIKPKGRRQTPGRPLQWATTDEFLDHFGLEKLRDLPGTEELKAAGLLDASPAINAYRSAAGIEGDAPEGGEAPVKQEDALPEDALDQVEEGPEEPLDPEGQDS